MTFRVFSDPVIFHVGAAPVTESMVTSLGVAVGLAGVAALAAGAVMRSPHNTPAVVARMVVEAIDGNVAQIIGRPEPMVANLVGSLFLFIVACNLIGQLPGLHPSTGNLATTSALAVIVFAAVPVAGIRARGWRKYARHYVEPNVLMLRLTLISDFTRTLALAVRLFGNIMSGRMVVALLVALAGLFVPVPIMALEVLIGILQAYIFAVLATVYIGAAVGAEEEV